MKKGLSDIVTSILFILIILIAIGIIWAFMRPFISESLDAQEGMESCYTISIQPLSCEYANYVEEGYPHENTWPLIVKIARQKGTGTFSSARIVVTDSQGASHVEQSSDIQLDELEQQRLIVYAEGAESTVPQKIEVAVYLSDERACPVTSQAISCVPYHVPLRCAEFDCDGGNVIDFGDYLAFVALLDNQTGQTCTYTYTCPRECSDFDGDGIVRSETQGFGDYFEFMHALEQTPPVPCP